MDPLVISSVLHLRRMLAEQKLLFDSMQETHLALGIVSFSAIALARSLAGAS
jgi:hypothetical protein